MTGNKGIGMTEGEWNTIVKNNAQREELDAKKKKEVLAKQRENMRAELEQ